MITLINCKLKLEVLGIYMERIGSGALFVSKLEEKMAYISWEYVFAEDKIVIFVDDVVTIPDMSEFGEVVPSDILIG